MLTFITDLAVYNNVLVWFIDQAMLIAVPLLCLCLAGFYAEKSNLVDTALEGKMIMATFTAMVVTAMTHHMILGCFFAFIATLLLTMVQFIINRHDESRPILIGLGISLVVTGIATSLAMTVFGSDTTFKAPSLPKAFSPPMSFICVALALCMFFVTYIIVYKTVFGLQLRALSQNRRALDAAGLSAHLIRFKALMINGLLCALAGVCLFIFEYGVPFIDLIKGQGFLALAILLVAKNRLVPVVFLALIFSGLGALFHSGNSGLTATASSVDLINVLPYLFILLCLVFYPKQSVVSSDRGSNMYKQQYRL